uniref:PDZ domain-containing protein n=1 Tax=Angiostrongylus cantonensis TaxID=6313 RepID=A0A0K0D9R5_ANGCA
MSYETISVRMNRSDTSIRWGFTLGQHGNKIVVATVDRESLSDKAGMKPGDEVDSICGRDAHNMSINDANSIVFTAHQEIHFNLRRYVTTHTCLPWTLTEKDNKLFVDEVQPGFGTGFGTYNTPVNLYSTESAAEQYKMQTGRPIESAFFQAF